MLSATRLPTMPYALRPKKKPWRKERPADHDRGNHQFVDPWLIVCERCPLEECALPEGGIHGQHGSYIERARELCPAERAKSRGWDAAAAVSRGRELGLLEVGE